MLRLDLGLDLALDLALDYIICLGPGLAYIAIASGSISIVLQINELSIALRNKLLSIQTF